VIFIFLLNFRKARRITVLRIVRIYKLIAREWNLMDPSLIGRRAWSSTTSYW
jgi:hypothetical protein